MWTQVGIVTVALIILIGIAVFVGSLYERTSKFVVDLSFTLYLLGAILAAISMPTELQILAWGVPYVAAIFIYGFVAIFISSLLSYGIGEIIFRLGWWRGPRSLN